MFIFLFIFTHKIYLITKIFKKSDGKAWEKGKKMY